MSHVSPGLHARIATRPLEGNWLERVTALRDEPFFWWLDSSLPDADLGRFSYAGADPWLVLRASGRRHVCDVRRAVHPGHRPGRQRGRGDPLAALRAHMPPPPAGPLPPFPFVGGAVGVLGYGAARALGLRVPSPGPCEESPLPDLAFLFVDRLLAFDHLEGRAWSLGLGIDPDPRRAASRAAAAAEAIGERARRPVGAAAARPPDPDPAPLPKRLRSGFDPSDHAKAVDRARELIAEGEVYQVCLTHRLDVPFQGDPFRLHGILRRRNPAPFSACLRLPGAAVVSSSPERFLQVTEDRWTESRPIKGTRPRGADPGTDRALGRALRSSPKDRAENLMIVDLVRNDLGRVCETASIHVPELMGVACYATVFQLVSTVRGRLRPDCDVFDAIRATFPPGSMTGAPKLAAMRILAELEAGPRGFYSGALGYLDLRGGCSLSVLIRAAILTQGRAHVHTGGGIVADSEPDAEWREAGDKARAVLEALALADAGARARGDTG